MRISSSRTFLDFLNVMPSPPSVIYSKLSMACVHHRFNLSLIPGKPPESRLLCPGSPFLRADLVPEIIFIHTPLRFGITVQWKLSCAGLCLPSKRLFTPILCNLCLLHLALFGPIKFLLLLVAFVLFLFFLFAPLFFLSFCLGLLGIPLIHCSSILGFAWLHAECYK